MYKTLENIVQMAKTSMGPDLRQHCCLSNLVKKLNPDFFFSPDKNPQENRSVAPVCAPLSHDVAHIDKVVKVYLGLPDVSALLDS